MINNFNNMDEKTLQYFKQLLEDKKKDLMNELDKIASLTQGAEINFEADFTDYGDNASIEDSAGEVADYATNLSLERDLESQLRDVEKALKRIEEGTYGICKYCNKEIEIDRLKARPESTSCISCKKALKGQV